MTAPSKNLLVLDGRDVKVRLEAERIESQSVVHVDWVRFTVQRRCAPAPGIDVLFPVSSNQPDFRPDDRAWRMCQLLRELLSDEQEAAMQAHQLAEQVAAALGSDFVVDLDIRKGHDFYKSRWPISRNDVEVAWVGFGASSQSPKQRAQANTIHVNVFGSACTFASHGWTHRIADLIDETNGDMTRCDLALDFFDGLPGGMEGVKQDYLDGLCNSAGKKLKYNMIGGWAGPGGEGRSFYIGSKEAGKQTNIYEKGLQLFGVDSGSVWTRIELRYGNKLRVLKSEMLRQPESFFAGASDWHASKLALAETFPEPQKVTTNPRLPLQTIEAEIARAWKWVKVVGAPSLSVLFQHSADQFLEVCSGNVVPGRLRKFSKVELSSAMKRFFDSLAGDSGPIALSA